MKPASPHVRFSGSIDSSIDGSGVSWPTCCGRHLIDGHADVGLVLLHRVRAAQEHGGRAHVVLGAAGVLARPRRHRRVRQVADDGDAVAERLERLQDFGELERRCPPPAGVHLSIVAPWGM